MLMSRLAFKVSTPDKGRASWLVGCGGGGGGGVVVVGCGLKALTCKVADLFQHLDLLGLKGLGIQLVHLVHNDLAQIVQPVGEDRRNTTLYCVRYTLAEQRLRQGTA